MPSSSDFITLIIVAQGRKEFLRFAINSALNQTIGRHSYEIIVVKDFQDQEIEEMIEENGIMGITVDPAAREKLSRVAVKKSKGNILCFLDDDDLYLENRLEKIREIFNDPRIGYYHNSVIMVNEAGFPTKGLKRVQAETPIIARKSGDMEGLISDMLRVGGSFNISSIAVRRNLVFQFMDYYEKLPLSLDLFLFYAAVISDFDLYIDDAKLSYYRVHKSVSNTIGSYEEFNEKREWFLKLLVEDHVLISEMVKGTVAEKYALAELSEAKLRFDLFRQTNDGKPAIKDYLRMLTRVLPNKQRYHLELILLSILSRVWPEKIRKMVYNRYMKEVGDAIRKKSDIAMNPV